MRKDNGGERLGGRPDFVRDWLVPAVAALCAVLLIRGFVLDVNVVRGSSMRETLSEGDVMVARKFGLDSIGRGDIVTAEGVVGGDIIVKRVVGLPGESVRVDGNGIVYVDGQRLPEEYQSPTPGLVPEYPEADLGLDEYYLMGDNRWNSYDSRFFGPVSRDRIRDVAVLRIWPFETYWG